MSNIRWELFPKIQSSPSCKTWLELQSNRQLSPRTVESYGRGLEDFLKFCHAQEPALNPEKASRTDIANYINELCNRPSHYGKSVVQLDSGVGLSHQTIQLRVTAVRLYFDHLVDAGFYKSNPVGRGVGSK